jgi:hypothetical protein
VRVFVLGGTGSIGSPIVRELVKRGHEVWALARSDVSAAKLAGFGAIPVAGDIASPARWAISLPQVDSRRIYDPKGHAYDGETDLGQTVHEFDFLVTPENEWYFVLAIFGLELTINLGGPDIEGYERWLAQNNNASPLYFGKNSIHPMPGPEREE